VFEIIHFLEKRAQFMWSLVPTLAPLILLLERRLAISDGRLVSGHLVTLLDLILDFFIQHHTRLVLSDKLL